MRNGVLSLFMAVVLIAPLAAMDAAISGDYLEVRTSDVYTGPCFANSEVNLVGKEAILAWRVRQGTWEGVPLEGLSVVAVVKASATLGDPFAKPLPAHSVIVVDERATPTQKAALVNFAQSMGGELMQDVVSVKSANIEVELNTHRQAVVLLVGDIVRVKTRGLNRHDHLCGNEEVYYPPLTQVAQFSPAYTLEHEFRGEGLKSTWSNPNKRSAFVGTFSR